MTRIAAIFNWYRSFVVFGGEMKECCSFLLNEGLEALGDTAAGPRHDRTIAVRGCFLLQRSDETQQSFVQKLELILPTDKIFLPS